MIKIRAGALICAFAVMLFSMAGMLLHADAAGTKGTLTLWCVKDDDVVSDMHWQIYRVGYRVDNDYVFEGDFENCRPTLGDEEKPMLEWDSDTVAAAAETLKVYSIAENMTPIDSGYTKQNGSITFSGLENGLYLVWGDILKKGNTTYVPSAVFFEMRGEEAAVLNAYPKIVMRTKSTTITEYSVRKVWENDEFQPWDRSVRIIAELYRDNEPYKEITLDESNDWTFSWADKGDHSWFVYEKVIPEKYTVAYKNNETQYLIINTYKDRTEESSGDTTTTTRPTSDYDYDEGSMSNRSSSGNDTSVYNTTGQQSTHTVTATGINTAVTTSDSDFMTDGKLPQTGQLWWPVPVFGCGGIVLIGIGKHLAKKDDDNESS